MLIRLLCPKKSSESREKDRTYLTSPSRGPKMITQRPAHQIFSSRSNFLFLVLLHQERRLPHDLVPDQRLEFLFT